jgi:hypothetical protein
LLGVDKIMQDNFELLEKKGELNNTYSMCLCCLSGPSLTGSQSFTSPIMAFAWARTDRLAAKDLLTSRT